MLKKVKLRLLYANQSNHHAFLNTIIQEKKKAVLSINPDEISMGEELVNAVHVGINFYGKSTFESNAIHNFNNSVDWLFSYNENEQKIFTAF